MYLQTIIKLLKRNQEKAIINIETYSSPKSSSQIRKESKNKMNNENNKKSNLNDDNDDYNDKYRNLLFTEIIIVICAIIFFLHFVHSIFFYYS